MIDPSPTTRYSEQEHTPIPSSLTITTPNEEESFSQILVKSATMHKVLTIQMGE
jgi:hypothetical protein